MEDGCSKRFDIGTMDLRANYSTLSQGTQSNLGSIAPAPATLRSSKTHIIRDSIGLPSLDDGGPRAIPQNNHNGLTQGQGWRNG